MAHNQMVHLKKEADGSIHIPAELARQAGLGKNKDVWLHVSVSRMTILSSLDPRALLSGFVNKIEEELGDLNSEYQMSDGRTVEEYLGMDEEQRAALWEDAFREALEALEKEPEQEANTDYVPSGQKHRAKGV